MGIYLGQLPPAEIARFKAELAETIIANFCYPRFFDYRTESLQTRPIDRTKRQEVWLYLSSVDFTAWSRVDLTSADFPHHIERLFIQFVQRNRSFFGAQGRRRMLDIRLSISVCAGSVSQRLRNHLTNQPNAPVFGSPRPVLSWTAAPISGRPEPTWEQIRTSTMELQQQLQQWRGEIRAAGGGEELVASADISAQNSRSAPPESVTSVPNSTSNGQSGRSSRPQPMHANPANPLNPAASINQPIVVTQQSTPPVTINPSQPLAQPAQYNRGTHMPNAVAASVATNVAKTPVQNPSGPVPTPPAVPSRPSGNLGQSVEQNVSARRFGGGLRSRIATSPTPSVSPARSPVSPIPSVEPLPGQYVRTSPLPDTVALTPTGPHPAVRPVNNPGQRELFTIGEDDVAIFEQMRRQLVLWLRIEALSAGLELSGQEVPTQLLEMLRQQGRFDETRLQVVSTLLNLATQVIKTGTVSVLDYKQALTFHLMHTRRP
jgi:hypothetical protein